jgi:4-hydroxy-2-oxovalerate aldolase
MKKIEILDTTLRDGSYVNNFRINADTTFEVVKGLDKAGIDYIEVGHGLGMNATTFENMKGICSDVEWIEATLKGINKSKWGMFFIPGIGRMEDIDLAASYNMDFIRIGANVDEYDRAAPFIERAKEKGMFVCANFMKTYALPYNEIGNWAAKAVDYGSDLVCIVDSAGAMLPHEVEGYVKAVKNVTDRKIGFHGHNNLGLAISNSIRAAELGVDVIDTSLRGLGRSAGNTVAEIFILVLERMGITLGYDIYDFLDVSERFIDPILNDYKQVDSFSILSGYAKFHSSFMPIIDLYSKQYDIDPRKLIVELCKKTCINAPNDVVEKLAVQLKNH